MTIELTFLGTGSMVPTKDRNVQSILLEREGEIILFDCGEGTQRQMNIAGYSRAKVRKVFLTHWHGDHVSGLIGLIQTIFNSDYQHTLHIYGPKGTKMRMEHLRKTVDFENKVDLEIHELTPGVGQLEVAHENEDYSVECAPMKHGTACIGYRFQEKDRIRINMDHAFKEYGLKTGPLVGKLKRGETVEFKGKKITPDDVCYKVTGKTFVLIPDTGLNNTIPTLADQADLMICEASFTNEHEHKAKEFKHLTAAQAALLAQQAGVSKLIITHFSQRYPDTENHLKEAKVHFPETEAAHDFLKVKL
ncbi:ribonuclease Z [Candidatus Woesearchaeota archaeon]|nr:ribonuclease Z [Candidatus Woesearchaeota archaeon]